MSKIFRYIYLLSLAFFISSDAIEPYHASAINLQDVPSLDRKNGPLKNISSVLLYSFLSPGSKEADEKILSFIRAELLKIGKVEVLRMEPNKPIDILQFSGPALIYQIHPLVNLRGEALPVMRATLNLQAVVSVAKTNWLCSPYIWSANCFWEKKSGVTLEQDVAKSLPFLLNKFIGDYKAANPDQKEGLVFRIP